MSDATKLYVHLPPGSVIRPDGSVELLVPAGDPSWRLQKIVLTLNVSSEYDSSRTPPGES